MRTLVAVSASVTCLLHGVELTTFFFCEDYLTKIKKKRRGGGERERIEHEINADNESGKTVTKNKIKGGLSSGGEE